MAPKKCSCCNKNITQKSPGLECSRCNKGVHATTTCAKLTNKQLAALRNSEGLEWSCEECLNNVSRRSSFFVSPGAGESSDDDEDQPAPSAPFDQKKLVATLTREMRKIMKAEIGDLTVAVEHMNGQMADLEDIVRKQEITIKSLINKNTELLNKNKSFELRISAMEQYVNELDQKMLSSTMEVAGVPETSDQSVDQVMSKIGGSLQLDVNDIVTARRMPKPKDRPQPGHILVEVKSNAVRKLWLDAAKKKELTAGDVVPQLPKEQSTRRIFIREALTHRTKTLLYNAQQKLKESYKYVWCKSGIVYVKKSDDISRPHIVRSLSDIEALLPKN